MLFKHITYFMVRPSIDITSIETTFEIDCFPIISFDIEIPEAPPTLMIDCIATGLITEMFCIFDIGTGSEMTTGC